MLISFHSITILLGHLSTIIYTPNLLLYSPTLYQNIPSPYSSHQYISYHSPQFSPQSNPQSLVYTLVQSLVYSLVQSLVKSLVQPLVQSLDPSLVISSQLSVLKDPTYQILASKSAWKPQKSLWWGAGLDQFQANSTSYFKDNFQFPGKYVKHLYKMFFGLEVLEIIMKE